MTDRPRGDGAPGDGASDFHWLYGSRRPRSEGSSADTAAGSRGAGPGPDETRVMPTQSRPGRAPASSAGARPDTHRGMPPRRATADTPPPAAPPPASVRRSRRRGGPRTYVRLVLLLVLLWVVYLVAVPLYAWTKVSKVDFEPSGDRPADQPGTTYLLVGSDSRSNLTKEQRRALHTGDAVGQRTDTIMLLHTGSGPNLLMSIPRDSLVPVPGYGTTKINSAYAHGGAKLLVRTIEDNTGIRIDDYVEVGFGGIVDVVDAVGGIQICPTSAMKDKLAGLDIKKGCQEADGATALGFARSRHTSSLGDIDRAKHQREVVSAVGHEVLSPWTFVNPVRYWRVVMAMPASFAFGEGTGPVRAGLWASAMTHVNGDSGLTCGVPIANLDVDWDTDRAQRMFGYIKKDRTEDIPKSLCTPSGLPKSVTG